jgi:hypothetical protein
MQYVYLLIKVLFEKQLKNLFHKNARNLAINNIDSIVWKHSKYFLTCSIQWKLGTQWWYLCTEPPPL